MECKGARPTKELRGLGPGFGRERLSREGEGPWGKQIEGTEGRAARIEERLNVETDAIVGCLASPALTVFSFGGKIGSYIYMDNPILPPSFLVIFI